MRHRFIIQELPTGSTPQPPSLACSGGVACGHIKRLRRGGHQWPLSGDRLGALGMETLRATAAKLDGNHKLISRGGQCVTSVVLVTAPGGDGKPRFVLDG